jgi:hypothetical protein
VTKPLAEAIALAQDFCAIVRQRQADRFEDWTRQDGPPEPAISARSVIPLPISR